MRYLIAGVINQIQNLESIERVVRLAGSAQSLSTSFTGLDEQGEMVLTWTSTAGGFPESDEIVLGNIADELALSLASAGNISQKDRPFYRLLGFAALAGAADISVEIKFGEKSKDDFINGASGINSAVSSFTNNNVLKSFRVVNKTADLINEGVQLCSEILTVVASAEDLKNQAAALLAGNPDPAAPDALESAGLPVNGGDVVSALMMVGSLSRMFGFAENHTSSSSSFNTALKKFLKKMSEKIWKEVMSGAVTEVAFASAVAANTAVSPSDPLMRDISDQDAGSPAVKMKADKLPEGREMPKVCIAYTTGVLTPSMDEVKSMGWGGGLEISPAAVKAQVKSAIADGMNTAKKKLRENLDNALDQALLPLLSGSEGLLNTWSSSASGIVSSGPQSDAQSLENIGDDQAFITALSGKRNVLNAIASLTESMPAALASIMGVVPGEMAKSLRDNKLDEYLQLGEMNAARGPVLKLLRSQVKMLSGSSDDCLDEMKSLAGSYVTSNTGDAVKIINDLKRHLHANDLASAMGVAMEAGVGDALKNILIAQMAMLAQEQIVNAAGTALDKLLEPATEALATTLSDLSGELTEKLQESLGDFAALVDPQLILSIYNASKKIKNFDGMSVGAMLFSLFASPSIKLALYDNGDFYVPEKSALGDDVELFKAAKDIERYQLKVEDPLSPFIAVIAVAIALEIARHFVPEPATQEALRIAKVVAVAGMSIAILVIKQEELQAYFMEPHREGVRRLYTDRQNNRPLIENMLFEKPVVAIEKLE